MKVLWTHNFDPAIPNNLVFVDIAADGLRALGVHVTLEYLGNLRSVSQMRRARQRVRELSRSFDLVHAQYGSACALATAGAQVPRVLSVRGNDWNVHDQSFGFHYLHTRLASRMTRWSLASYDTVIAVSNRMASLIRAFRPSTRLEILPSAINLNHFVPRDRAEARRQLGEAGIGERWVLFNAISLNDPIKRYGLAQAAFAIAARRRPALRMRLATGLSRAIVPTFVAACDVILCTSETEGWPNSVKEALACNVPFVSTDVSDLAEIARVEPTCRVCPADPDVLADALCAVIDLPVPDELRRHVEPMGLERSSAELRDIYSRALSRAKGPF